MLQVAVLAAVHTAPSWDVLLIKPLQFIIYVLLCPLIYLMILFFGIEMAVPGGTPLRALVRRHGAVSPIKIALANDPTTRILSVVAGLLALAFWSTIATSWLAGYLHFAHAPSLERTQASTNNTLIFITTFVVGLAAGDLWATGVRTANTARACLGVLSISMALSGTLLFFYIVEMSLRDLILVTALGIFTGELAVAARHPMLLREGLFDVMRSPLEDDKEEAAEPHDDADDDGANDGYSARTGDRVTAQTRAFREHLSTQPFMEHSAPPGNEMPARHPSGDLGSPREGSPTKPG